MDIAQWLQSQWAVIASAPVTFIVMIGLTAAATAKIMQRFFSSEAAAAKIRVEHCEQLLAAKEKTNDVMENQLKALGEAVDILRKELAERPRVFIQKDEPKDVKPNDMWVQP